VPVQSSKTLAADSEETTFELSGDPARNVTAIVIDADQYTLSMIHDLHTVFPTVKLIALSSDPAKRLAAVKAGATLALPKTTPPPKLAKVVKSLAGPVRTPASGR
jgi:DNA-binding NarL/FixJ family response regulator